MVSLGIIRESVGQSSTKRPEPKRTPSKADTLPTTRSTKTGEPRRQISNPVHRSATHAKEQYGKASPLNSSRIGRHASTKTPHPGVKRSNTSYQTRYVDMLLNMDAIPRLHNILAAFFTWILLAGFVVFPGTFTSIKDLSDDPDVQANPAANAILAQVKNVPLLVIAAVACGIGAVGMVWLAFRWRQNYVWMLNRLFLPGAMNGLAGLISSLVSVYTHQHGNWSVTAKVTAIAEGSCLGVCAGLFVLYNNLLLSNVKKRHGREVEQAQSDEGFLEKADRKLHEAPLEPGSVV